MDFAKLLSQFVKPYLSAADSWIDADSGEIEEDQARAALDRLGPAMQRICRAIGEQAPDPSAFDSETYDNNSWSMARGTREAARRLQGILESKEMLDDALSAESLAVNADGLHEWVWRPPASKYWSDGHYRAAVQAAATQVDIELQAKLNRFDISGSDLAAQAFSLSEPSDGKRRLRYPKFAPGSETYKSVHQGAMHYGMGVGMVIRNTATHLVDDLHPQSALEQLVSVSYWARLIDKAAVEEAES